MNGATVKKVKTFVSIMLIILMFMDTVYALPQDGTVVGGNSTITQPNSTTMQINQATDKSIINWQGYSIAANEKVQYFQPSSSSISLNRVIGADPSYIYGQLTANGQVWVINPNGLLIGNGANINVSGFLGSTLNIGSEDFMNGKYNFKAVSGQLSAISNLGNITAADGGYAVLISPSITNEGNITSNLAKTYLASADEVTLNFAGHDLIGFTIDKAVLEAMSNEQSAISNRGTITANGGEVILSAKAAGDLFKTVINNEGVIEARTIENRNGVIKLLGGMESNSIKVGGTLDASAPDGGDGGFIETSAAKVKIEDSARITTYAPYGKTGTWLIDPQDYTIAASGGDITGSQLSANLNSNNVTILSSSGGTLGNGDINVNDNVIWSANTLTLTAARDININAAMTASGTSILVMNTSTANGSDSSVSGGTIKVGFNSDGTFKGRVDFPSRSGTGFLTINGSGYTVINSLGAEGSTTGTDLQGIQSNTSGWYTRGFGYYALGSDIDASATSSWNGGFTPIGHNYNGDSTRFVGIFDGLGHTITGLTINRPYNDFDSTDEHIGLFGYAGRSDIAGTNIRNVGMVNGSITGGDYVGGLVSDLYNAAVSNSYSAGSVTGRYTVGGLIGTPGASTISNSYSAASVTSTNGGYVGGLIGTIDGAVTVSDSYSTGNVNLNANYIGNYYVGGLAGWNNGGTISNSYSTGNVSISGIDGNHVGGLMGANSNGVINNSYSTGNVNITNGNCSYVGGLAGFNGQGTISNSYSTGSVSGTASYVGGLVGYNDYFDNYAIISNSYSTGNVNVTGNYVGGLVGYNDNSTITNSYSAGSVSGTGAYVGGLMGYHNSIDNTITASYWDTQTSGRLNCTGFGSNTGCFGETTANMKKQDTFTNTGWNFTNTWNIDSGSYISYPYLRANEQDPHPGRSSSSSESSSSSTDNSNTAVLREWLGESAVQNKNDSKANKIFNRISNLEDLFIVEVSYGDEIFVDMPETCILECK
jgi:filamentous hemagglutinin family protein